MSTFASINAHGLVDQIIVADQAFIDAQPGVWVCTDDTQTAAIGMAYSDGVFSKPVPHAVTMRQARLALLGAGLLPSVDTTIAALPEPQKSAAKIEWEYSQEVQRHNGFVSVLAPTLGLTEAQIDALFVAAGAL